jgi:transcriptional regulator with XRE-family HTH domain
MQPMQTVADRLKYAREKRGMSQTGLATAVGITFQSIQAIEGGGGSKHLSAIARALRVNLDWLESGAGSMDAVAADDPPRPDLSENNALWHWVIVQAEQYLLLRNESLSPEDKADYIFLLHEIAEKAENRERFDPAQYSNIVEFVRRRR